jgi:hypothetical protein
VDVQQLQRQRRESIQGQCEIAYKDLAPTERESFAKLRFRNYVRNIYSKYI